MHTAHLLSEKIRRRFISELGISASVGIANNKIIAKLGSDYKKPNASTLITPDDYDRMVWSLPASDLLYVGEATAAKLARVGITTIGAIARASVDTMRLILGKNGETIHAFARGEDSTAVALMGDAPDVKSIGNSTTTPRDLYTEDEVRLTFWMLAESVAERLREHAFRASTLQIYVRDKELKGFERQVKISRPTQLAHDFVRTGMELFKRNYHFGSQLPIRSLGVRGCNLLPADGLTQMSMFAEDNRYVKLEMMESAIDRIRARYGHFAIQRASMLTDSIGLINPKDDHTIHPVSYFIA